MAKTSALNKAVIFLSVIQVIVYILASVTGQIFFLLPAVLWGGIGYLHFLMYKGNKEMGD